jgi:hypothetical protein
MIGRPRCMTVRPEFEKPLSRWCDDRLSALMAENPNETSNLEYRFAIAPCRLQRGK